MNDRHHDDTQPVYPGTPQDPATDTANHPVFGPPPPPPSFPPPGATSGPAQTEVLVQQPPHRGRKGFAAAVVAAALVVGGAAGVGGAAAWSAFDDEPASGTASPSGRTTSQVVDTPDGPAADGSVESVASSVLPSVVKINVSGSDGAGSGSGIILSSDGQILTNNHVASLAGEGGKISVSFNDGTKADAEVVGTDALTDLAVIQAQDVDGLTPATLGSSDELAVGEGVVAIGSPFGLDATVTSGIVSALNRPVDVGSDGNGNTTAYPAIQTDAAINPGNSGGALVDMNGHVVGINSSIQSTASSSSQESGSIGLGFAIPIDDAMPIVEQIIDGETPTHARLGITVSNVGAEQGQGGGLPQQQSEATVEGAEIQEIGDGSAAGKAGLEGGDVITKVDDQLVSSSDDLIATIRSYRPGDTVTITFQRDGSEKTAELKLDSDGSTSRS
ncbi:MULTISPECIES: S1C family serine protease [unclassified Nocardioides]|uniref:S1C family serine protease n=1 Tax=unclassified Nocardioides TaxID=2615069 RepID=UPI0030158611